MFRRWFEPLTTAEQRHFLLVQSDRESGSPRQWLLLELAAAIAPAPLTRRSRLLACLPALWLSIFMVPAGQKLYAALRSACTQALLRGMDDAFLLLTAIIALLAGFGRLPASQQFAVWLLLIGGLVFKSWRHLRLPTLPAPESSGEETVPGAEAALGLQGLLLARGGAAAETAALLQRWKHDPANTLPELLIHLPELAPPAPTRRHRLLLEIAGWTAVLWPATCFLAYRWGWLGVIVLCCGLSGLLHHRWRQAGLIALTALLMFALARLIHWV